MIPVGVIVALTLTAYTLMMRGLGVEVDALRTGSTIILAVVGIWILAVLSRPLNRYKGAVVGVMFVALVVIFSIGLARGFFVLVDPGESAAIVLALCIIVAIGLIEVVRVFQRRFVARSLTDGGSHGIVDRRPPVPRPLPVSIAVALIYIAGIGGAMFGVLFLLARYEVEASEVVSVSLVGVGIILFALLSMAAASGLRRGSGLSRVFITVLAALLIVLQVASLIAAHAWSWWSTGKIVLYAAVIAALWAPAANRFFRPVLRAGS